MNKKFKLSVLATALCLTNGLVTVNATPKENIIPIISENNESYVSLKALVEAYNGTMVDEGNGRIVYTINNKVIIVNNEHSFIYVDNEAIPYATEEMDGIVYPNFYPDKVEGSNGEILFPVYILEDFVGIKPDKDGFKIPDKEKPEVEKPETEEPETEEPDTSKPEVEKPDTSKPDTEKPKPDTSKPETEKPKPDTSKPEPEKPKPDTSKPEPEKPEKPEPPKPVDPPKPPKPEPPPVASGMSFSTFAGKATSLGWVSDGAISYTFASDDGGRIIGRLGVTGGEVRMSLLGYSNSLSSAVSTSLSWLVPDGASKAMSIVNSNGSGTVKANNRTVSISNGNGYPVITIR